MYSNQWLPKDHPPDRHPQANTYYFHREHQPTQIIKASEIDQRFSEEPEIGKGLRLDTPFHLGQQFSAAYQLKNGQYVSLTMIIEWLYCDEHRGLTSYPTVFGISHNVTVSSATTR